MSTNQTTQEAQHAKSVIAGALEQGLNSSQLEIPVMPRVAQKVFSLTNDPNADVGDLSKLIHDDQSIASHVLRIANSATYGGGDQIVSLQQAVARLGMNLLGEIAIAVSIQSDVFKAPGYEAQVNRLLKHALASGAYGKEIARKRRRNVEGQFLCGLLHSIGKPISLQLIGQAVAEHEVNLEPKDAATIVSVLSPQIAKRVAIDWNLPKQIQVTTLHYRTYDKAPSFKDESAATYLSQLLANWIMNPTKIDATSIQKDPVFEYLNFYPDDVEDLLDKQEDVKAVVAAMEL
ncbi:HDOD domain-containing protein [Puniceicoccaceae bacterium K14]|nr:HDOD domain-containing protein [Puniceicoccaceae bacterium K14]